MERWVQKETGKDYPSTIGYELFYCFFRKREFQTFKKDNAWNDKEYISRYQIAWTEQLYAEPENRLRFGKIQPFRTRYQNGKTPPKRASNSDIHRLLFATIRDRFFALVCSKQNWALGVRSYKWDIFRKLQKRQKKTAYPQKPLILRCFFTSPPGIEPRASA